ncbi:unnamed protein product [Pleuronectes platessa]|uniref:Uncharacterized protein n=1 Tax=Pleuronectes platessa TaxID=8262 RepID=A0A9N7VD36_PLEPL|nr:unnamed protein product [Pleuronectes platessa]
MAARLRSGGCDPCCGGAKQQTGLAAAAQRVTTARRQSGHKERGEGGKERGRTNEEEEEKLMVLSSCLLPLELPKPSLSSSTQPVQPLASRFSITNGSGWSVEVKVGVRPEDHRSQCAPVSQCFQSQIPSLGLSRPVVLRRHTPLALPLLTWLDYSFNHLDIRLRTSRPGPEK